MGQGEIRAFAPGDGVEGLSREQLVAYAQLSLKTFSP